MCFRVSYILLFLCVGIFGCILNAEIAADTTSKITGVSFAGSKELIDSVDLISVKKIHAKWITLMPYGFIRDGEKEIKHDSNWQWVGETSQGIVSDIQMSKRQGLKVMLKPHVWISRGEYTGEFKLASDSAWVKFESSYSQYILDFARIAEKEQVELFCIGTEWRAFVKERPLFWDSLIKKTKKVYSGKITYAANWDEYGETPFWNDLDYIGVNAYFPLSDSEKPLRAVLEKAWEPILAEMGSLSYSVKKQILFTEYGYRSIEGTTIRPWEFYTEGVVSMGEQEVALDALLYKHWDKTWFAGGFLWKWFNKHPQRGGEENAGYTIQNKPAELVVKKYYELEK